MDKTKRVIFIDLDGTILNNDRRWYRLHLDLAKSYRFQPINRTTYLQAKKNNINERIIIQKTNIVPHKINAYIKKRINLLEIQKYLLFDKVKPGMRGFLKKFANNYQLILVTKRNKPRNCLSQLNQTHLLPYFSKVIITKQDEKDRKVRKYLSQKQIQDSVFVGDTEDDYQTARKLKINCLLVTYGARNKNFIQKIKPPYIADTVEELTCALKTVFNLD